MTSAAGLALGGMHPVVAVYSTFLNRAFDQLLMDVALLRQPVTVVLDRAGVTGSDGASHNGMWDLSLLGIVPGIRVAAPRDGATLREELGEALDVSDGPTVLRFPKGSVGEDIPALERLDGTVDVLRRMPPSRRGDALIVAVGRPSPVSRSMSPIVAPAGHRRRGRRPRWVFPVPDAVVDLARGFRIVVTIEDSGLHGGVGSAVSAALRRNDVDVPTRDLGVPQQFLDHASRNEIHAELGLTAQDVARQVTGWVAGLDSEPEERSRPSAVEQSDREAG